MIKEAIKQYQLSHTFDHFDPKCVLFDMDGVLYDSMRNHAAAWQEAMAQFDIHFTAADSYATEGARGVDTIRHFVRQQQGREIDEAEAQRMYDVKADLPSYADCRDIPRCARYHAEDSVVWPYNRRCNG